MSFGNQGMAKMTDNLPKNTPPSPDPLIKRLIPPAERLPDPDNYLAGLSISDSAIPKNIIVFQCHTDKLCRLAWGGIFVAAFPALNKPC